MAKRPTRIKTAAVDLRVPQSREEATEFIAEIGRVQRMRERIQADMNDQLAAIRQEFEERARPLTDDIQQLSTGVQTWCEANRDRLTQSGKVKYAHLASGEVKWRMRPPKVALRGLETIIEACKRLRLERFVRTKEEVNKEAMLAEPELAQTIAGVTISRGEDFVIVPFETELEEVA